jgi:hypothetical protein
LCKILREKRGESEERRRERGEGERERGGGERVIEEERDPGNKREVRW